MGSRGYFISFEGGEGAGKTTQLRLLGRRLEGKGVSSLLTREPGGSEGAEQIRQLLVSGDTARWSAMTEALLHTAARVDHVERMIEPALAEGRWVICDRFVDSTTAYQGAAQGLGMDTVRALHKTALDGRLPSLTVILDLPVEIGLTRAGRRNGETDVLSDIEDRYERMGHTFHETLRQAFLEIAAADTERCVVIDATLSVDDVAGQIWGHVTERFLNQ